MKIKYILLYIFLACTSFIIGYFKLPSDIVILDNGDCFTKKNPMCGISLVELYAVKLALDIGKYNMAEARLQYFLEEHDKILSLVSNKYSNLKHDKVEILKRQIKELKSTK